MKTFLINLIYWTNIAFLFAQAPTIEWQHCIGGTDGEAAYSIIQTSDSGYAVLGVGSSVDGDGIGSYGYGDYWLVKLDQLGAIQWQKIYGGSSIEYPSCIIQKSGGGYVVAGATLSNDSDVLFNHGNFDIWVVSLDDTGGIEWQRSLGGSSDDNANSIRKTVDGGFIVVGSTESLGGDVSGIHGPPNHEPDFWVVKLNSEGDIQWENTYGGLEAEEASSVVQMPDGGFIVAGYTKSSDGDVSGGHGVIAVYPDYWVIRIDSIGNLLWQRCLGGTGEDVANTIVVANDSGCVVAGYAYSTDGDVATFDFEEDEYWLVNLSDSGEIIWAKTYGGSGRDRCYNIVNTYNDGYIISGYSATYDGGVTGHHGYEDYWLVKIDSSGILEWEMCYGGSNQEDAYDVKQTFDGGYILAGFTESNDGDVIGLHGMVDVASDYWIVKLCNPDNEVWYYMDSDSDRFGNKDNKLKGCVMPAGYVNDSTDCDDTNPFIYPSALEILNGLDDNCNQLIDEGLSIDNILLNTINIYPNPAENMLFVEYGGNKNASIQIIDFTGKTIYTKNDIGQINEIDVSKYSSAVYLIKIIIAGSEVSFKFVKE